VGQDDRQQISRMKWKIKNKKKGKNQIFRKKKEIKTTWKLRGCRHLR
jgi:hypothetical protein